jgi:hypothetical protein
VEIEPALKMVSMLYKVENRLLPVEIVFTVEVRLDP